MMLGEADLGFLFHAPENVKQQFPRFTALESFEDLLDLIKKALG
jgi:phosphoserine/homoserine phosphotransferase